MPRKNLKLRLESSSPEVLPAPCRGFTSHSIPIALKLKCSFLWNRECKKMLKQESLATSKWAQHSSLFQPRDLSAALWVSAECESDSKARTQPDQPPLPMARFPWARRGWLSFMPILSSFPLQLVTEEPVISSSSLHLFIWGSRYFLALVSSSHQIHNDYLLNIQDALPHLLPTQFWHSKISVLSFSISCIAFRFSK